MQPRSIVLVKVSKEKTMDSRLYRLEFVPESHKYFYWDGLQRKELHGITGIIGKRLGKSFPDNVTKVQLGSLYGKDVHKESEMWIKEQRLPSSESGNWVVSVLKDIPDVGYFTAETLVSDFETTTSCIDVVAVLKDGTALLYDIKTTSTFDREYCSLQLSVYKYLYERCYNIPVTGLYVIATKARKVFRIIPKDEKTVIKLLEDNK